jgi:uncharacterized protein (DUF952 family)
MVYHIASEMEWEACAGSPVYTPARFAADGFIHCSTAGQLQRIADTLFSGHAEVWLLCIDSDAENEHITYENLEEGSELFPHIYRELPKESIRMLFKVKKASGTFHFPPAAFGH